MGGAYLRLSDFKDRAANLKRAIECFQRALKHRGPKAAPMSYARWQNNLGNAYFKLARIEDRDFNLYRAVECYQSALKYFTSDATPLEYTETQYDLGLAYRALKDKEKARAAFQAAKKRPRPILRIVFELLSMLLFVYLLFLISLGMMPLLSPILSSSVFSSITPPTNGWVWILILVELVVKLLLFALCFILVGAGLAFVIMLLSDTLMKLMRS